MRLDWMEMVLINNVVYIVGGYGWFEEEAELELDGERGEER